MKEFYINQELETSINSQSIEQKGPLPPLMTSSSNNIQNTC